MTMAAIGVSAAGALVSAGASYGLSQINKPKGMGGGGVQFGGSGTYPDYGQLKNWATQNQADVSNLVNGYQGQIGNYSNDYLDQLYKTSSDYLNATNSDISSYGSNMTNLANSVVPNSFNASQQALGFNMGNLGNFGAVADVASNQALATRLGMLNTAMPAWNGQYNQGNANASSMMRGEVPADVQGSLNRTSAFNALGSGAGGGSGLGRNLTARDLGLTSLDLQSKGTAQAQSLHQQQFNMGVAGLQINPYAVMQNNGVSAAQAQGMVNLATGVQETGYGNVLSSQMNQQNTNLGQVMGAYGNVYNTKSGAAGIGLNDNVNATNNMYQSYMNIANQQAMYGQSVQNAQNQYNAGLTNAGMSQMGMLAGQVSPYIQQGASALAGVGTDYLKSLGTGYNGGPTPTSSGYYGGPLQAQQAYGTGNAADGSPIISNNGLGYYMSGWNMPTGNF